MLRLKIIILLTILVTTYTFAQQADKLIGKYRLPNMLDVEIFKSNDKYSGKIIALGDFDEGQTTDINNPEKSKRNNPLIGMVIINNLEFDKDEKQWINGEMYGPEKGMIFNLKITELRQNEIEVVGSKYLFWKTLVWKKI